MVWFRNWKRTQKIRLKQRKLGKTHVHNKRVKGFKKKRTSSEKKE